MMRILIARTTWQYMCPAWSVVSQRWVTRYYRRQGAQIHTEASIMSKITAEKGVQKIREMVMEASSRAKRKSSKDTPASLDETGRDDAARSAASSQHHKARLHCRETVDGPVRSLPWGAWQPSATASQVHSTNFSRVTKRNNGTALETRADQPC